MTSDDREMPLYLKNSSLYVKLVCIYAKYADREGLHYEPISFEQYEAGVGEGDDNWTEDEWKEAEKERKEDIKTNQEVFAREVRALVRIANGNCYYDDWEFLRDVWDALGCYGDRDEELDALYEKLHKAWSRKRKKKEELDKAVRDAISRVAQGQLA